MTAKELSHFRSQLQALTAQVSGDVKRLEPETLQSSRSVSTEQISDDPVPQADLPHRKASEDVSLAVMNSEGFILQEAEDALRRIEAGVFGQCEECGHAISHARLEAVPYARFCIRCARESELTKAGKS